MADEGSIVEVTELKAASTAAEEEREGKNKKGEETGKVLYDASHQQKTADLLDGAQSLITVVVLCLCCIASFSSRLFAVIRFESIIHEFDPW